MATHFHGLHRKIQRGSPPRQGALEIGSRQGADLTSAMFIFAIEAKLHDTDDRRE